jgi:hypothetical protein
MKIISAYETLLTENMSINSIQKEEQLCDSHGLIRYHECVNMSVWDLDHKFSLEKVFENRTLFVYSDGRHKI